MSSTRPLRVGHKGAAALAPGNTPGAFDAALDAGVDMIEFDVLSERADGNGRLLVAHDYVDVASRASFTFEQALEHLGQPRFANVQLDVDLKLPGYEMRALAALREHGLVERTLVSGMFPDGLAAMRRAEPALRVGWSVPRVRRDYASHPVTAAPAWGVLLAYRRALPARAVAALQAGRCDALMAHWRVVTAPLLERIHDVGGRLFVWTVDDAQAIRRLTALGVDGIITNDPRLFAD